MTSQFQQLTPTPSADSEARCHCGQLMAILRKDGVELKCKRCKRITLIPFSSMAVEPTPSGISQVHGGKTRRACLVDVHVQS